MSYPMRQFEIGKIYHIINRGVEKRVIFKDNQDYLRFILGLYYFNHREYVDIWTDLAFKKDKVRSVLGTSEVPSTEDSREMIVDIFAFALMPNHYHLIIKEIIPGGITKFMTKMSGYSKYFNKRYDRVGPLVQGRYKAINIKDEIQLINLFSYVHTNPVELKEPLWKDFKVKNKNSAIELLEDYRWSSYRDYIGKVTFPSVTQREFFLELLGGANECKRIIDDWISFKAENFDFGPNEVE